MFDEKFIVVGLVLLLVVFGVYCAFIGDDISKEGFGGDKKYGGEKRPHAPVLANVASGDAEIQYLEPNDDEIPILNPGFGVGEGFGGMRPTSEMAVQ